MARIPLFLNISSLFGVIREFSLFLFSYEMMKCFFREPFIACNPSLKHNPPQTVWPTNPPNQICFGLRYTIPWSSMCFMCVLVAWNRSFYTSTCIDIQHTHRLRCLFQSTAINCVVTKSTIKPINQWKWRSSRRLEVCSKYWLQRGFGFERSFFQTVNETFINNNKK